MRNGHSRFCDTPVGGLNALETNARNGGCKAGVAHVGELWADGIKTGRLLVPLIITCQY